MNKKLINLILLSLCSLLFCSGCVHSLEVKNLNDYRNESLAPLKKPLVIGVVPTNYRIDSQRLAKGIGRGLSAYSATVLLPYAAGPGGSADVIANIDINSDYKGSGWNFLINWPGGLARP